MKKKASMRVKGKRSGAPVIGFVGAGNMATALIKGFLAAGLYRPEQLQATDVDAKKRAYLRRRYGVGVTADNAALVAAAKTVIFAVKPQIIDAVLSEVAAVATPGKLFISIAAGVPTARLEAGLGKQVRVLRVMPNTPALLGKGMSVLVRGRYATDGDERLGLRLLRAVGDAIAVRDEGMLDAVTGLSGSGPAYVYRFAEGMISGGIAAGLPGAIARQLTLQTIVGAAAMLQETGETPERLRAQVSSPGGTTLAGLAELERRGFKETVADGVIAATRRSQELGRQRP